MYLSFNFDVINATLKNTYQQYSYINQKYTEFYFIKMLDLSSSLFNFSKNLSND